MQFWVIEEVGPVWISLHVPKLKQLSQAQHEYVMTDLQTSKAGENQMHDYNVQPTW